MTLTTLIPAAVAAILLAGAAHAAPQPAAVKPVLDYKVCTRNCLDPDSNGPALSGRAVHAAVKPVLNIQTCVKNCMDPETNGPALSGRVAKPMLNIRTPTCARTCQEPDSNGPALSGLAAKTPAVARPLSPPPFLTKG